MRIVRLAALLFALSPGVAWAAGPRVVTQDVPLGKRALTAARAPITFNLVGVRWRGSGTVLFRTRTAGGHWSSWRPGAPEPDGPDAGSAEARRARGWHVGNPYWTDTSTAIQYRLRGQVRRLRASFVWSPVEAVPPRAVSIAGSPLIRSRASWGAVESIRRHAPRYARTLRLALVHHTAGSNNYSPSQSAAIVRGIELFHVRSNGWDDIAYNFLVDKYGQIFEGRYGGITRNVVGAHAMGFNTGSVGVSLLGNYDSATPTPAQLTALQKLLAWRLDIAHLDPLSPVTFVSLGNPRYPPGRAVSLRAVSGHRDTYPTACPGARMYSRLAATARATAAIGLPKIYAPRVQGSLGSSIRFTARLSASLPWTVTIRDAAGAMVARGAATGLAIDWTWDSSVVPRRAYAYAIETPGARPVRGSIGGRIAAPPPPLLDGVGVSPTIVSPATDGSSDFATISYALGAPATVTATFSDDKGTPLGTLFSEPKPAGRQSFRFSAAAVPDGRYRITLQAVTAAGKTATGSAAVLVSRVLEAFTLSPALVSPNGDRIRDRVSFSFEVRQPTDLRIDVVRRGTVVATPFSARVEAGRRLVQWDVRPGGVPLPNGRYDVVAVVGTLVSFPLTLRIDTTPPTLSLLSLAPLRFRVNEAGRATVFVNGRGSSRFVFPGTFRWNRPAYVRSIRAFVRDAAGNRSRLVRYPR